MKSLETLEMLDKTVRCLILACCFCLLAGFSGPAHAATEQTPPPDLDWSFDGPLGTYDRAAMQRGYLVYRQVCAACHSMDLLSFRNLTALGYDESQVKAIAAEYMITDGPDDEGEMFERPGLPSDPFPAPFPNVQAAKYANNNAFPPDMSLLAKARVGGPDYIYGILVGYGDPPHGEELGANQYWNRYMPGHLIAMAPPLSDGLVAYADGAPQTVNQYARDVAHFLMWAAEPHMEERKQTGLKVLLFLIVFAGVLYAVKKKIWKNAH